MSRLPRAGTAGKLVGIRATDVERTAWERTAKAEGCATLSAWIVKTLNTRSMRASKRRAPSLGVSQPPR